MAEEIIESQDTLADDEFKCDLCGEEFDTISGLEEHFRDHHQRHSRLSQTENWNVRGDIGAAGLPGAP